MDDVARVAVFEGVRDLHGDVENLAQAQRPVPEDAAEVRALDERHDEEEGAIVASEVVDRDDPGMVHLRDDLRLALETLLDLGRQLRRGQQLDGDVAVQQRIARAVHDSHAAAAELGRDLVAVGELRAEDACAPVS